MDGFLMRWTKGALPDGLRLYRGRGFFAAHEASEKCVTGAAGRVEGGLAGMRGPSSLSFRLGAGRILFVSQHHHRIDAHRTPRLKIARRQRHHCEQTATPTNVTGSVALTLKR